MITIQQVPIRHGDYSVPCPVCSPHRTKTRARCLGIKNDGTCVIYHCFHCGIKGKLQLEARNEFDRICKRKKVEGRGTARARTGRIREGRAKVGRDSI